MVERFQAGEMPVFLLSLKAGAPGSNLTRADHVVHVDRWWNPAVEEQATDRAYRIGQTKPVQVHRMITRGTIEEKVAELLTRKRALADAVLGGGETALTELSDAELRDLVTLRRGEAGDVGRPAPRVPPRRSTVRATTWWGKAWVRAVEGGGVRRGRPGRGTHPGAGRPGRADLDRARPLRRGRRGPGTGSGPSRAACRCSTTATSTRARRGGRGRVGPGRGAAGRRAPARAGRARRGGRRRAAAVRRGARCVLQLHALGGPVRARPRRPPAARVVGGGRPFVLLQLRGLAREDLLARLRPGRASTGRVGRRRRRRRGRRRLRPGPPPPEAALYAARLLEAQRLRTNQTRRPSPRSSGQADDPAPPAPSG